MSIVCKAKMPLFLMKQIIIVEIFATQTNIISCKHLVFALSVTWVAVLFGGILVRLTKFVIVGLQLFVWSVACLGDGVGASVLVLVSN